MVLAAAELATEIQPTRVAGMRKEANPAVAAAHRAVLQIRTVPQRGVQRDLILTNERFGAIVLVPILAKSKNFRDDYRKIIRFSVKMLIGSCISSSYYLDAKTSRRRARIFSASAQKISPLARTTDPRVSNSPVSSSSPADATSPPVIQASYLERKRHTPTDRIHQRPNFFLSR
jgi:hypothetical protein